MSEGIFKGRQSAMLLNKIATSLLSVSLVAAAFTVTPNSASARGNKIDQLLVQHSLNPTKCGPGVVAVWVNLNQQAACAAPNAQYPAGTYRLTNGFQIFAISQQNPTLATNANLTINVFNVGTPGNYPSQPVSPVIGAQINASFAAKGLSLTACSANPGVVVMMDQYMACAYPTHTYPSGRYSLAF
ncbi:hypothetical protein NIES1031_13300 [Chroogloeocystis siderophila 5.2 s.c.1]|uniref:Uncharacterized protein n=2 Tax=Chroogloeocystis TaxID=329162 RepID=A0A1U7HPB2_9CHRO|nr:hypothetical protein [Chroogloeocystis siderophila]OKH25355.1 hypothetical protein NIES1031_13300 [Chroogloeocystis siderophila 5.2 s.c.1]